MPAANYIPARDADFENWLANFSALLTAAPTDYGLVSGDAVIVAAAYTAWNAAFLAATNPSTRTGPTIAAKDAARASATATVRPYAQAIAINDGVSNELKLGIGVNPRNPERTIIPAPTTIPVLGLAGASPLTSLLSYRDASIPSGKAKPFGAVALQVYRTVGTASAVSPDEARYVGSITKSPFSVPYEPGDVGKVVTYWGRWQTKSGPAGVAQVGPWSTALSYTLM